MLQPIQWIQPKKGSRSYSILKWKCPGCQQTDLFISANPYRFGYTLKMPDRCPVCGADFVRETGFYSAALWTSYPITIAVALPCILILLFVFHMNYVLFFLVFSSFMFLMQPLIMRTGRAILLNMFIDYQPNHKPLVDQHTKP
jgi:Protein of unknown function (DUF983)